MRKQRILTILDVVPGATRFNKMRLAAWQQENMIRPAIKESYARDAAWQPLRKYNLTLAQWDAL